MKAAVIGLGAEGLSVAVRLGERGRQILGIDTDPDKVLMINSGFSYVRDIRQDCIRELVTMSRLVAYEDLSRAREADTIIFCLSTPLVRDRAEVSYLMKMFGSVARQAKPLSRFIVLSQLPADEAEATLAPELRAILSRRSVDLLLIARSVSGSRVEGRGSRSRTKKPP